MVSFTGKRVGLWENVRSDLNFWCKVTEDILQTFGHIGVKIRRVSDGKPYDKIPTAVLLVSSRPSFNVC